MCSVEGRIDRSIGENQQALHAVVDVDVDVEYRIHSHYITYHVSSFPYPDTVMVDMYYVWPGTRGLMSNVEQYNTVA